MKLSSLIGPDLVRIGRSYANKDEIMEDLLLEVFRRRRPPLSLEGVRQALAERESLGGTVFPTGIATPHARLEGFDDLLIAVGVPERPVRDGDIAIRAMVLLLTSRTASTLYLNALAAWIRISQDEALFSRILGAPTAPEFVARLRDSGVAVKKELTIDAVMSRVFPTLRPDSTVKNAADLFYKNKTSYLPVLDEEGRLLGELTVLDLFRIGIPDYAEKVGSMRFLKSFGPFDDLLSREDRIPVGSVMKPPPATLEEDSPVIEAMLTFARTNRRYIPVLREGRLTGIVSYMDILHKVLRA